MKTFLYTLLIVGVFAGCALNRHVVETPEPEAKPVEITSAPIEAPEALERSTRPGTNTVVDAANSVPSFRRPEISVRWAMLRASTPLSANPATNCW